MNVLINGKTEALPENTTLTALLTLYDRPVKTVVMERNGQIVPMRDFDKTVLSDGDQIEIVHFVGGG
ncbi:MAG: sulfur carrier protein ThiS [Candidatus Desulfovibrio kirbyi]|uniref:Sulfur carrier protein ThiS n=1 Tax=Candidatus Desulfovibrio kirbyi TaxID=2696086 RepID=A0A6L2R6F2_9BACT|nr:sulfur carrier protein ThiS [Desulfovibrio sp.]GFH63032.1 MAG: sulfur carrier protein ThiS [Candidatus Desulfovibrio kirbyi]